MLKQHPNKEEILCSWFLLW